MQSKSPAVTDFSDLLAAAADSVWRPPRSVAARKGRHGARHARMPKYSPNAFALLFGRPRHSIPELSPNCEKFPSKTMLGKKLCIAISLCNIRRRPSCLGPHLWVQPQQMSMYLATDHPDYKTNSTVHTANRWPKFRKSAFYRHFMFTYTGLKAREAHGKCFAIVYQIHLLDNYLLDVIFSTVF